MMLSPQGTDAEYPSAEATSVATADDASVDSEDNNTDDEEEEDNANNQQDFLDAMEDVHTRFILNLPESELEKTESLFFQLEQAWWFYEDWICDNAPPEKNLPRFSHLKPFAMKMFEYSFLLPNVNLFKKMWNEFAQFKRKISNFGCILLNESCTKVVLCQVWNGKSHTFPSGKINQGETGIEAAARETYEETGFDPHCQLGTTRDMLANQTKITWSSPLQEQDALSYQEAGGGKRRTCYVCCGVPEDFPFAPVCRKEVSKIAWYNLDKIPKPNYAVGPFLSQLKRWIKKRQRGSDNKSRNNKKSKKKKSKNNRKSRERGPKAKAKNSTPRKNSHGSTPGSSRQSSRQREREQGALVESGLASEGDYSRFTEDDMFKVNEQLLGRKIEYDGNPHFFSEQGFAGKDPHAFHVVGGSFLNSGEGISSLAPPPPTSKLQPLFRNTQDGTNEGDELQPFFSDEGETPWGDVVSGVSEITEARMIPAAAPPQSSTKNKSKIQKQQRQEEAKEPPGYTSSNESDFFTDAEITKRSQAVKTGQSTTPKDPRESLEQLQRAHLEQYEADMEYIRQWVANLPKPRSTPHFGEFKLDAAAIVEKAMAGL